MTDCIRRRWRTLPPWTRVLLVVAIGGFLEGTGAHALDLARHGLGAYSSFAPPLQVFFSALVVLDPLVAVPLLYARPAGVLLGAVVMTADTLGNWYANWSWLHADWTRLPHPVGMLPITLFGLFVLVSALPPARALTTSRPVPVG
ncbi:hypothetical protein [Streptomyces sp. HF10]|uniref:hypothetical protein n=1 Tax=Streptomyces sp. HF10 TaxID=2692233 RepID=UPI001318C7B0|nr:hypothetical protein [Streptomyces sp. HF10]QHC28047.1 hypothetical protein GR129_03590 [Streptomyces sp. HF10]